MRHCRSVTVEMWLFHARVPKTLRSKAHKVHYFALFRETSVIFFIFTHKMKFLHLCQTRIPQPAKQIVPVHTIDAYNYSSPPHKVSSDSYNFQVFNLMLKALPW